MAMEFTTLATLIKKNCPEILEKSWKPVKSNSYSSNATITKFGGQNPFRGTNFKWPRCQEPSYHVPDEKCGEKKYFIFQVNVSDLPDTVKSQIGKESGLFQFFWCMNCEAFIEFSTGGDETEGDLSFIARDEMIPNLQTLSAFAVFRNKINIDNIPDIIAQFVKDANEPFRSYFSGNPVGGSWEDDNPEKQVQSWEESEVTEIPYILEMIKNEKLSKQVLSIPGIKQDMLETVCFCNSELEKPISGPHRGVKLCGYVRWANQRKCGKASGCSFWNSTREEICPYPSCQDCGLLKDIPFLQFNYSNSGEGTTDIFPEEEEDDEGGCFSTVCITICPGCGKPGATFT